MKKIKVSCSGAALVDLDELISIQGNLKDLSKENFSKLKKSILKHGFAFPFHIWKNDGAHKLLDGTQRLRTLKAMREEGYYIPKLPVDYIEAKDEKQAKELILANVSEFGNMTQQGLYEFIENAEIDFNEIDLDYRLPEIDFNSFVDEFYADTVEDEDDPEKDDAVPEAPKKARTQLGDLIELGEHRLVCGDSTDKETVDYLMNGEKADMVFTDPPYGIDIGNQSQGKGGGLAKKIDYGKNDWDKEIPHEAIKKCLELAPTVLLWGANYYADKLPPSPCWIIWDKDNGQTDFADCELAWTSESKAARLIKWKWAGMLQQDMKNKEKRVHPTQKPTALAEWYFKRHDKAKNIIDLFGGSGSTLIACEKTNRKCYMMELDPIYCDVIVQRYCDFVKNDKIKINGKSVKWNELSRPEE